MARTAEIAAAIVIQKQAKTICVVNQNHDSWSLPKGHVDPGETARQAAERETHEEAGLVQLEFIKPMGSYQRYKIGLDGSDDTSELKNISVFLYQTDETDLAPLDPANPEARWLPASEVAGLLTHRLDKKFFSDSLDMFREYL